MERVYCVKSSENLEWIKMKNSETSAEKKLQ